MATYTADRDLRRHTTFWRRFLVLGLFFCLAAAPLHAAKKEIINSPPPAQQAGMGDPVRTHFSGELTAVEDTGHVLIDGYGYLVDPSVLVVNALDRPIKLETLKLPVQVEAEYTYAETATKEISPTIVYIKEARRSTGKAGNQEGVQP